MNIDFLPRLPKSYQLVLIAAKSRNNAIGKDGAIPWRCPAELKQFKEITMGHTIVMGRKTADGFKKPLSKRNNIVLTRDAAWCRDGFNSVSAPLDVIELAKRDLVFVIGGGEIYNLFIDFASGMIISNIHSDVPGNAAPCDTFFPPFRIESQGKHGEWEEEVRLSRPHDGFSTVSYQRIQGNPFFKLHEVEFIQPSKTGIFS